MCYMIERIDIYRLENLKGGPHHPPCLLLRFEKTSFLCKRNTSRFSVLKGPVTSSTLRRSFLSPLMFAGLPNLC